MLRSMEEAALNSWPALQQMLYDGWVLRFSKGYTKRANSVNPLYLSRLDSIAKVVVCEGLYRERSMPPIFRLTPLAPEDLDGILDVRGYKRIDPTLVMRRDLAVDAFSLPRSLEMRSETVEDWMAAFCDMTQSSRHTHGTHIAMLQQIVPQHLLASLRDAGQTVACALGVRDGDHIGIFDLIVDPLRRNNGYGAALMAGILNWGQMQGAHVAYLQVVEENAVARHLYEKKLGFEMAYRYWYRVSTEW